MGEGWGLHSYASARATTPGEAHSALARVQTGASLAFHTCRAGWECWLDLFDMDQWCIMQPQSLKVQCEPYFAEDLIGAESISRREFHLQVSLATARCCTLSSDTL